MAQEENIHLFNISERKYKFTLAQPISGHSNESSLELYKDQQLSKATMTTTTTFHNTHI